MKYAVISLAGRQFKVSEGDTLKVNKLEKAEPDVLLYSDGDETEIGDPFVTGINVKIEILEQLKDKKLRVGRFKSKSRYSKVRGHRQLVTLLKVVSLGKTKAKTDSKSVASKTKTKTAAPKKLATKKGTATLKVAKK